jgi:hypothetical protein
LVVVTAPGPAGLSNATEEYDGSSWTAGGNLNTARRRFGGAGIQTAALAFGGNVKAVGLATEQYYDGTSWTSVPPMATARSALGVLDQELKQFRIRIWWNCTIFTAATEEWSGPQTTATASTLTTS